MGEELLANFFRDLKPWVHIEAADCEEPVWERDEGDGYQPEPRVRLAALGYPEEGGSKNRRPLYLLKALDFRRLPAWKALQSPPQVELLRNLRDEIQERIQILNNFLKVDEEVTVGTLGLSWPAGKVPNGYSLVGPRRLRTRWSDTATKGCQRWVPAGLGEAKQWLFEVERYWLWENLTGTPHHDPMVEGVWHAGETGWWPSQSEVAGDAEPVYLDDRDELVRRFGGEAVERYAGHWQQFARKDKSGRAFLKDVELAMFEQVNSEHCRHHIFNAQWKLADGSVDSRSLFDRIRETSPRGEGGGYSNGLISCYADNAAVFEGHGEYGFFPVKEADGNRYWEMASRKLHLVAKAETHNHPTGISPWPGAATGVGGEIRDEAAVGRGGMSKAGVAAYMVSDLGLPVDGPQALTPLSPEGALFAGPRMIMCDGPLGAARYGNEFGRPQLAGAFRTLELRRHGKLYGYDKPLMLAGGLGNVEEGSALKDPQGHLPEALGKVSEGDHVVVLGGAAARIGLGGGSASSRTGDGEDAYASVQRADPEMQRRCQQVIDACRHSESNPILLIHDVGAGGLSNAIPELLHDAGFGMEKLGLEKILTAEAGMSPLEVWCNESQERFVLIVKAEPDRQSPSFAFKDICKREGCFGESIGVLVRQDGKQRLRMVHLKYPVYTRPDWQEKEGSVPPINVPLDFLFSAPSPPLRSLPEAPPPEQCKEGGDVCSKLLKIASSSEAGAEPLDSLARAVLRHPAVASKAFLIHIADRNVGGLTVRDQLVGPLQMPVADCATTLADHFSNDGEALAMGEKPALALYNPAASARMALGEAVTNIAAAPVKSVSKIRLSANWMAACRASNEEEADPYGGDRALYDGVEALSTACCKLGVSIPVGKDSLFMASDAWQKHRSWVPERSGTKGRVRSPMSVVLTAFAAVKDVANTATPLLRPAEGSCLVRLGLSDSCRLGGSILEQLARSEDPEAVDVLSLSVPDLDSPQSLVGFLEVLNWLRSQEGRDGQGALWAYHDISDGGLLACLAEIAFTSGCGLEIKAPVASREELPAWLLHEELGAVLQIPDGVLAGLEQEVSRIGLHMEKLGVLTGVKSPTPDSLAQGFSLKIRDGSGTWEFPLWPSADKLGSEDTSALRSWTNVSDSIRLSRGDDGDCVRQEYVALCEGSAMLTPRGRAPCARDDGHDARIAILRANGSNGHAEMALAFERAGLTPVDVHMSDLWDREDPSLLDGFGALAFVGGFSYGDVLGAGIGWAMDTGGRVGPAVVDADALVDGDSSETPWLKEKYAYQMFEAFFKDESKLVLGICNGCQVLSLLWELIPGAHSWPNFLPNSSGQHEARLVQVGIDQAVADASPWLRGMGGTVLPVAVSHGEGRAKFYRDVDRSTIAMRYRAADHSTEDVPYPANPNGSEGAVAAVSAAGGRVLAMMPHPERSLRNLQLSWCPEDWNPLAPSPWQQMFNNAADWLRERK